MAKEKDEKWGDFTLDDILKAGKPKSHKKRNKQRPSTVGQEVLNAIEAYDAAVREAHRPLDEDEKRKLEILVNEAPSCCPDEEDMYIINKIVDILQSASNAVANLECRTEDGNSSNEEEITPLEAYLQERPDICEFAFALGMAYERLKSRGLI